MTRCRFLLLLASVLFLLRTGDGAALAALPPDADFGDAVLRVRVVDRLERPVSGVRLRFRVDRDGQRRVGGSGGTYPVQDRVTGEAVTDANGVAAFHAWRGVAENGFGGSVRAEVAPADGDEIAARDALPLHIPVRFPAADTFFTQPTTLHIFERADRMSDGFPVWLAGTGRPDRIVVLLEGFDLYNRVSAADNLRLIASALDAGPDDTPPFAEWYALPDNSPARAHDEVAPGAVAFTVGVLLAAPWQEEFTGESGEIKP